MPKTASWTAGRASTPAETTPGLSSMARRRSATLPLRPSLASGPPWLPTPRSAKPSAPRHSTLRRSPFRKRKRGEAPRCGVTWRGKPRSASAASRAASASSTAERRSTRRRSQGRSAALSAGCMASTRRGHRSPSRWIISRQNASPKRASGRYQRPSVCSQSASRSPGAAAASAARTPATGGPKVRMPTGVSGSGSGPRSKLRGPAGVWKTALVTSVQSWSSVATQKTGTAGSPRASSAAAQRATAIILEKV